ncbi:hypothetical protein ES708_19553 [subsurface metagenome]
MANTYGSNPCNWGMVWSIIILFKICEEEKMIYAWIIIFITLVFLFVMSFIIIIKNI